MKKFVLTVTYHSMSWIVGEPKLLDDREKKVLYLNKFRTFAE